MTKRRLTTQRIKILEYLAGTESHPTAEAIHQAIKKEMPSITLATVYRNLNLLANQGIIIKFKIGNTYHFDGKEGSHEHAVCTICGKILDVEQPTLSEQALKNAQINDFHPEKVRMMFFGICKTCEEKRK